MKKIFLFSILIVIVIIQTNPVFCEVEEEDLIRDWSVNTLLNAIDEKNDALESEVDWDNYFDMSSNKFSSGNVLGPYYDKYGYIVKGKLDSGGEPTINNPDISILQSIDDDGDYRIIGKNILGEWVENPFYDPVVNPDIDKRNWIRNDEFDRIRNSVIGPLSKRS